MVRHNRTCRSELGTPPGPFPQASLLTPFLGDTPTILRSVDTVGRAVTFIARTEGISHKTCEKEQRGPFRVIT